MGTVLSFHREIFLHQMKRQNRPRVSKIYQIVIYLLLYVSHHDILFLDIYHNVIYLIKI